MRVTGRIRVQGPEASPLLTSNIAIALRRANAGFAYSLFGTAFVPFPESPATAAADGTFTLTASCRTSMTSSSVRFSRVDRACDHVGGVDVLNTPWTIAGGESGGELVITLSDSPELADRNSASARLSRGFVLHRDRLSC